jgi:hypothetical protein
VEVLAERQDHEEREHHHHLRPVREPVAGFQRRARQSGERRGDRIAEEREGALVRDRGVGFREQREAKPVEGEVGDHDGHDEAEHHQGLAVALQARRLDHEAAMEGVPACRQHGRLDNVLAGREEACDGSLERHRLVVADRDQLQLAGK